MSGIGNTRPLRPFFDIEPAFHDRGIGSSHAHSGQKTPDAAMPIDRETPGNRLHYARDLGANTMYIRVLGHHAASQRDQDMLDLEQKTPQSATLVGPDIGKVPLFVSNKSGLIFDNQTRFIAGSGKHSLYSSLVFPTPKAMAIMSGRARAPYTASDAQVGALSHLAKKALVGRGTVLTDKTLSYLKHEEIKGRFDKKIKDVSSKFVLADLLQTYLPDQFDKNDIQPFSRYREALLSKMEAAQDNRRGLIEGALDKLAAMEKEPDGERKSIAYLTKAVKHRAKAKYTKFGFGERALRMNEYMIIPDKQRLMGILVARGDEECAMDLHKRLSPQDPAKSLPFYSYDKRTGELTKVERSAIERRIQKRIEQETSTRFLARMARVLKGPSR